MKKISVMLLAALMLFAFVACNDDANDGKVAALGASDKKIAQEAYAAVVKDLGTPSGDVTDKTLADVKVDNVDYTVKYSFDLTKATGADAKATWKISIEVTNDKAGDEAYKMTFELGSADLDKNITVKVNDDSYTVAAADIKGDNKIGGIETTDDPEKEDPEETTPSVDPSGNEENDDTQGDGGSEEAGGSEGKDENGETPDPII